MQSPFATQEAQGIGQPDVAQTAGGELHDMLVTPRAADIRRLLPGAIDTRCACTASSLYSSLSHANL